MFETNKSQVGAESLRTSLHCSFVPRHSCSRAQFVKAGEPGIISHMSMNFRTITNQLLQSHERAPTPYFWPNFLYRVTVYLNEYPTLKWALHSYSWSLKSIALTQALSISKVRNFKLYFTKGYCITRQICDNGHSQCAAPHELHHNHGVTVPFRVRLCAIRDLTLKLPVAMLCVIVGPIICFKGINSL